MAVASRAAGAGRGARGFLGAVAGGGAIHFARTVSTMAGSDSSKDTQEEKSQLHHTDLASCLNLDVRRDEQWTKSTEDPKGNVMLSCMKASKDKDPGEKPRCPRYTCISAPTLRDCSAISSIQIYQPVQCSKAGQKVQQEMQQKLQQKLQQEMQQSHKCWAKSTGDPKNVTLCCLPEVLEKATAVDVEKLGKTRSSRERRDSGNPTPMLDHPTPTHIPLCLDTNPGYQPPELGQESSQGWVIAVGTLVPLMFLGFLVLLVFLGLRWWRGRRGRRETQCANGEALKAEEGLEEKEDEDEM